MINDLVPPLTPFLKNKYKYDIAQGKNIGGKKKQLGERQNLSVIIIFFSDDETFQIFPRLSRHSFSCLSIVSDEINCARRQ